VTTVPLLRLTARIQGRLFLLEQFANGDGHRYDDGMLTVRVSTNGGFSLDPASSPPHSAHIIDVGRYQALATLLRGITDATRIHAVNTPLLASQ
jgi:hypothetical protein